MPPSPTPSPGEGTCPGCPGVPQCGCPPALDHRGKRWFHFCCSTRAFPARGVSLLRSGSCRRAHVLRRARRQRAHCEAVRADQTWPSPTSSIPGGYSHVCPQPYSPSKCYYLPGLRDREAMGIHMLHSLLAQQRVQILSWVTRPPLSLLSFGFLSCCGGGSWIRIFFHVTS